MQFCLGHILVNVIIVINFFKYLEPTGSELRYTQIFFYVDQFGMKKNALVNCIAELVHILVSY